MEARTGLVIGGMAAVAASIAVVTAVALANTAALAESPGTSVASERIIVPSAASPSATARPAPATAADALTPSAGPEVVEAPAPVVVEAAPGTNGAGTPNAPATVPPVADPPAPGDIESAIAAAEAAGTWDAVRNWAALHGWPSGRLDALIARLEREAAAEKAKGDANSTSSTSNVQRQALVSVAPEEEKPGQQTTGSQRPAHAGTNVGNGNGAGRDAKKDQSRTSPDKRD